ncbi:hypothetical protein K493DRAFT_340174 [Basidiobolus meristosporus CBS 931.73]|uniref:Uncharacterized protein n=1 Tax=Basidiobolus meristosporus CBS 931.73 TaxID=1314790 RepID=A0A1Y1XX29_9FUNG|nr:hypothetical protein K493DRAFT_340174 [Basidiobolus meristosporus CBS 931.73]|eukprot:ORX90215.1 hypothetical protein K493DRAFT_340174 [Basidiobolus meristosporus CBS 931.73]
MVTIKKAALLVALLSGPIGLALGAEEGILHGVSGTIDNEQGIPAGVEVNQVSERVNYRKKLDYVHRLFENFMYPNNTIIAKSGKAPGILAADIRGRVDITWTFNDLEENIEYLFGLFSNLASSSSVPTILGVPKSYTMFEFAVTGEVATTSVIIDFVHEATGIHLPVQVDVWLRFNHAGEITQYDAVFRRWSVGFRSFLPKIAPLIADFLKVPMSEVTPATLPGLVQKFLSLGICQSHDKYCLGKDQQYKSNEECLEFLQQKVPLGLPDEMGQDNVLCRVIHVNMIPYRPDFHCPHIGPTGGGMCVNRKYEDYFKPYFPQSFIGKP